MRIQASLYGGRAGDIYGDPIPAPSIYGHLDFIPAMFLGSVETWRAIVRLESRRPSFVPSPHWPEPVRAAVIDALAEALLRELRARADAPGQEGPAS